MKTKILLFSAMLFAYSSVQAQWFNNGAAIYFNDTIGIGPVFNGSDQSPTQTLDVDGTVRIRSLSTTWVPQQNDDALGRVLVTDDDGVLHWRNAASLDTNTQLSEADVDGYVSDNGYLTTEVDGNITNEIQNLSYDNATRVLSIDKNGANADLSYLYQNWGNLQGIPAELLDGDDNTQLSEAQVDNYVANNGYAPLNNPDFTGNVNLTSGNLYGRFTNADYSNLYRFGGLYLTWDSDNYGTNTHHSIRSTYGDVYGDDITINSFDRIRLNLDSNNNNPNSYFEIGEHTTGVSNVLFRVGSPGNVSFSGALMPNNVSGIAGQVLTSAGAGAPPTWTDLPADTNTQLSELQVDDYVANNGYAPLNVPNFTGEVDMTGALQFNNSSERQVYGASRSGRNTVVLDGNWDELEVKGRVIDWTGSNLHIGHDNDHSGHFIEMGRNVGHTRFLSGGGTSETMRVASNGYVGIGETNPNAKLHIKGNYSGGSGDFTNVSNAQLKIQSTSGYIRIPHISAHGSVSTVYNFQTGKDVYWGESGDTGNYFFRGRNLVMTGGYIDSNDETYFLRNNSNNKYGIGYNTEGGSEMTIFSDNYIDFTESDGNGIAMRIHGNAKKVSINSTNNYGDDLWVNSGAGKPGGGFWGTGSDLRLKQDITPFTDGLEQIQQIKPVWYRYNGIADFPTNEQYVGIIAQEIQEIAPYTVDTFTYEDEEGNGTEYLKYNGSAVTYMLINAIKEQQQQIEAQKQKEETLQQRIERLQQELETLKNVVYGSETKSSNTDVKSVLLETPKKTLENFALYQNVPNPFNSTTTIKAMIPESVQQAKIIVYNLQGLELESYDINQRDNVAVEISAGRFPSGMYLYALMADGQLIDTKKMVLTR